MVENLAGCHKRKYHSLVDCRKATISIPYRYIFPGDSSSESMGKNL